MKAKRFFALILFGLLVFGFNRVSFSQEKFFEQTDVRTFDEGKFIPGEIIVKFKEGVSHDKIRQVNEHHGASTLSVHPRGQFMRLRTPQNKSVEEMVANYSANPNVEYAEPNYIVQALFFPNDPYYSYQWHLDNNSFGGIHTGSAWDFQTGNSSVIVAVVDTGVAYEDFGSFKKAPDLANTSFVVGYDYVNNDTHPNDDNSHGTHVTGTIAQSTNNGVGVAGVAFKTSVMPVKVLDKNGFGSDVSVANGIYFAADNGAKVINLSLGSSSPSTTLENALAYAFNKGVTIVCAAGNEYQKGNLPSYPAAYDKYCIAVGATRFDETRSYYSNTGAYLDLAAPGGDTSVDQNNDGYVDGVLQQTFNPNTKNTADFGYWFFQGTSMATPHVSGVAALLIAKGVTGPDQVRTALQSTAEDKGTPGWDQEFGWGLVDANVALQYAPAPIHDVAVINISAPTTSLKGDTVSVVVSVANQGDFNEDFAVSLSDTTDIVDVGNQLVSLPAKGTANVTFQWNTSTASLGDHALLAEASSVTGETNTANNTMTTTVKVQEPVHDVAVIALNAPLELVQGIPVSVVVTVENQGTFIETPMVSLSEQPDNAAIGFQSVTLNAGASTQVSFNWNTSSASIGNHTLKAEASSVTGETDTADNSMTTVVTIKDKSSSLMHVANISMALAKRSVGKNQFTKALATVTVTDGNNNPITGATVSGSWSGATTDSDVGTTDSTGKVTLISDEVKKPARGTKFTFTVNNVSKSGLTYDSASNVETSDFITVP